MNEEKWKLVDEKIKAKLTILSENSRAKVCSTNCLVDETMMVISEIYHSEIEQAEKDARREALPAFPIMARDKKRQWKLEVAKELKEMTMAKAKELSGTGLLIEDFEKIMQDIITEMQKE